MADSEILRNGELKQEWALGVNTISASRAFCASGARRSTARSLRDQNQIDLPGEISYPRIPVIAKQPSAKNNFGLTRICKNNNNDIKIPELEVLRHADEVVVKQIKPKCLESKLQNSKYYYVLNKLFYHSNLYKKCYEKFFSVWML